MLKKLYKYLFFIWLVQFFLSFLVKCFYPDNLVLSPGKVLFNKTIFFSLIFIILSALISYSFNNNCYSKFNGSKLGMLSLTPLAILLLTIQLVSNGTIRKTLIVTLSLTFFHLGGFREIFLALLGPIAIFNFFISINCTIITHMFGFFIGDIIFHLRKDINGKNLVRPFNNNRSII